MGMGRGKKLTINTITSLLLQITTLICGFILPRLILRMFGSEVNGLVNSITQFLGIISLLDLGVTSVVQSSLYKPLAESNWELISKIYVSAHSFFKKIAFILLAYLILITILYPFFVDSSFGYIYVSSLIFAIGIGSFFQYYFGIVNSIVLNADQMSYVLYISRIITVILNTLICYILLKLNFSIQIMKLASSLVFIARPVFLAWYVNRRYPIDRKVDNNGEPIKQKWNGIAQHFASFVLTGTDSIILTCFSSLSNVSIYGVYNLVITGLKNMFFSISGGFESLIGDMLARNEKEKALKLFAYMEWFMHNIVVLIFGCTGVLIVNFVKVYTNGINDANYVQPFFATLLTIANAGHCLRLPYSVVILAAGHYKQTQSNYIITVFLNIIVSIIMVFKFGLIGVAIGTLVAMFFQTIWMAWYDSRNIIEWPFNKFIKQLIVDCISVFTASLATFKIPLLSINYKSWFFLALEVACVWFVIVCLINFVFYRPMVVSLFHRIKKKINRKLL